MVDQLTGAAPEVRSIWLPPLPAAVALDAVAGPLDVGLRGMRLAGARPGGGRPGARQTGPLLVPLGLLDDPARQWQGQWLLDLTVAGGHAAVIGGPQSGRTTLLRTLVLSLALTHTPQEVGVYGLDLVGGGLQALSELPHVGGVAGRADRERAARTVEEVRAMLTVRENLFREHGIDSVEQLRTLHAAGRLPRLASAEILLVIDGFGALRDEFDDLDDAVADILKRGGGYGIHVVASMLRWNDVRIAVQSNFGTRIELRLNDPGESSIDRKLAATLSPTNRAASSPTASSSPRSPSRVPTAWPTRRTWGRSWSARPERCGPPGTVKSPSPSGCCPTSWSRGCCRARSPSLAGFPSGSTSRPWRRSCSTCSGTTSTFWSWGTPSAARRTCCGRWRTVSSTGTARTIWCSP